MDADIKKEFNNLKDFLREHVALKADLVAMEDRLRHDLACKADLERSTTVMDKVSKLTKDYYDEMAVLRHRVERMEKWIMQVAESTGVKYEA